MALRAVIPPILARRALQHFKSYVLLDHFNQKLHTVSAVGLADIDRICEDSNDAFLKWSRSPVAYRVGLFEKLKGSFRAVEEELSKECSAIGLPAWFVDFNVQKSSGLIDNYMAHMVGMDRGSIPTNSTHDVDDQFSFVVREPLGPVLGVSPWNAPVVLALRSILAPLAAGCSVVVKSSEQSAQISYLIVKAFVDAGFPAGVVQLIHTAPEDVPEIMPALIGHRRIKACNFTGSTEIGKKVSELCGRFLKPCLLELGGKNSVIIDQDVKNLETALHSTVFGAMAHRGQICMCTDKLYIHESLYDSAITILKRLVTDSDDPEHRATQRNSVQAQKIQHLIDDAVARNAKVLVVKETDVEHENYIGATVLTDVPEDSDVLRTETFGPVLTVHKFASLESAIDSVNDADDYGLKVAIWTSNHLKAINAAKRVQAGGVHINSSTINDEPWLPHGGVKESGNGRFNARWGIESFSYVKTVTVTDA